MALLPKSSPSPALCSLVIVRTAVTWLKNDQLLTQQGFIELIFKQWGVPLTMLTIVDNFQKISGG